MVQIIKGIRTDMLGKGSEDDRKQDAKYAYHGTNETGLRASDEIDRAT